jgi:hypothetical protein
VSTDTIAGKKIHGAGPINYSKWNGNWGGSQCLVNQSIVRGIEWQFNCRPNAWRKSKMVALPTFAAERHSRREMDFVSRPGRVLAEKNLGTRPPWQPQKSIGFSRSPREATVLTRLWALRTPPARASFVEIGNLRRKDWIFPPIYERIRVRQGVSSESQER